MPSLTVEQQDDLIRALIKHPDNFQRSPQFALGYMVSMLTRAIDKLPQHDRDMFVDNIHYLIDRNDSKAHTQKVAG